MSELAEPRPEDETPKHEEGDQAQPAETETSVAPAAATEPEPAVEEVKASVGSTKTVAPEQPVDQLWYVIHTQTGQELKVKSALDGKIQQGDLQENICEVLVPTERVAEVRGGKKQISERKFFPGYLLVRMRMTDENWHLVRTTPGVTGFIGAGRRPIPLSEDEVSEILRQTEERKDKPTHRVTFQKGEGVRVTEGPFTNFSGAIEEVNLNRGKVKVMVSIFGRQTPVELEFWQIERL